MDPWSPSAVASIQLSPVEKFEDNFVVSDEPGALPDSVQYLAALERRLARIKKSSGKITEKEILNSIEEKKRDCMVRLLAEDFEHLGEDSVDEDIPTKWLKSHINPQQPLSVSELVELVKADYLAKASEETEDSKGEILFFLSLTSAQVLLLNLVISSNRPLFVNSREVIVPLLKDFRSGRLL
ncbi:hypothetical protein AAG570_013777 [Ranatra chinensis]|uniref:Uncharacterized protein n=1 Tax=Ranatra chinensis TaxID=642074 RepID=A0ABD0YZG1_9HEMI